MPRLRHAITLAALAVTALALPQSAAQASHPGAAGSVAFVRGGDVFVGVGGTARRLTFTKAASRPRWSPRGQRIAFVQDREVWVMKPDGTGKHQITRGAQANGATWSPDALWIAYITGGEFSSTVVKVRADGSGTPVQIYPPPSARRAAPRPSAALAWANIRNDRSIAWSPDGTKIALPDGNCTGIYDDCLTVFELATGRERILDAYAGGGIPFSGYAVIPQWTPNSRGVIWTAQNNETEDETPGPVRLHTALFDGSQRHSIGLDGDRAAVPAPDGTARLILTAERDGQLWIVHVDEASGERDFLFPGAQPDWQAVP